LCSKTVAGGPVFGQVVVEEEAVDFVVGVVDSSVVLDCFVAAGQEGEVDFAVGCVEAVVVGCVEAVVVGIADFARVVVVGIADSVEAVVGTVDFVAVLERFGCFVDNFGFGIVVEVHYFDSAAALVPAVVGSRTVVVD